MQLINAVLFDMDGVVVDTAKFHHEAWKKLALELGIDFPDSLNDQIKGVSRMDALKIILDSGGLSLNENEMEKLAAEKNNWYLELLSNLSENDVLPGIHNYLMELKKNDIQIGLASASKNAKFVLDKIGLKSKFQVIIDGHNIKNSKPDPEVFLSCSTELKIDARNCLVIEDAKAGVEAAKRAGMMVIGIGDAEELSEADIVIESTRILSMQFVRDQFHKEPVAL